jgi:hypothetical protein
MGTASITELHPKAIASVTEFRSEGGDTEARSAAESGDTDANSTAESCAQVRPTEQVKPATSIAGLSITELRSKIEKDLRGRVAAPFVYRDRHVFEIVSTGIPGIDAAVGGLPRGAMTEIFGPPGSGRTSFLVSALAARTANGEVCALVDGRDSFDPAGADAAGVALKQLLWVRCRNIEQVLRATDLLIQSGGFGLVAVDLSDIAPKIVRYVPLNAWFRFRRAVEDTPTILMLAEQESNAKSCASLVLRMNAKSPRWMQADDDSARGLRRYPFARLWKGFEIQTEVVRSRMQAQEDLAFAVG